MRLKKEIILFYTLILVSAGVIIAADQPATKASEKKSPVKCCKINKEGNKKSNSTAPLYYITDGIFRYKA